jgi:hypothetical protein
MVAFETVRVTESLTEFRVAMIVESPLLTPVAVLFRMVATAVFEELQVT